MKAPLMARMLRIAEVLLLVLGVTALGWVGYSYTTTARDQANWARELEQHAAMAAPRPTPTTPVRRVAHAQGSLIGRLEVPRLGVSVMTREGTDARTLRRAVGHVRTTALPGEAGNAAFAGHRDTFFRGLRNIRAGDRVIITTTDGRHEYAVRETRVVAPTDVSVLDPTPHPTLTLVTCYPFNFIGSAPRRFIVRAEMIAAPTVATAASGNRR